MDVYKLARSKNLSHEQARALILVFGETLAKEVLLGSSQARIANILSSKEMQKSILKTAVKQSTFDDVLEVVKDDFAEFETLDLTIEDLQRLEGFVESWAEQQRKRLLQQNKKSGPASYFDGQNLAAALEKKQHKQETITQYIAGLFGGNSTDGH